MTQIPASRNAPRAVRELGGILSRLQFLGAPTSSGRTFYSTFGLDLQAGPGRLNPTAHGGHPHLCSIVEGPRNSCSHLLWRFRDHLARFRYRLEHAIGLTSIRRRLGVERPLFFINDPDGPRSISGGEKSSPKRSRRTKALDAPGAPAHRVAAPSRCAVRGGRS